MSDIDVTIPGSVESVSGAASRLEDLRDNFSDANLLFTNNSTQANSALVGELGSAVTAFSDDLSKACNDAYDRAKKAADTIRSFANQLSWRKDDMNDHLETARGYDLVVEGNIIRYPEAVSDPGDLPKGCTKAEQEEWRAADEAYDAYLRKVKHFEKVRGKVNGTFEELNDWIDENLATTESEVLQNTRLTGTKALLATALDKGYSKVVKHKYAAAAEELRGAAEQAAIKTTQDASANPQVHARKARPSDKVIDRKGGKGEYGKLEKKAISKKKFGKNAVKLGGGAITIGFAAYDLVRGESPSETILTTVTGTIAGEMPGLAAIVVAPAVAAGTTYAYETRVSQETREKIDEGLVDSKNWAFDNLGDARSSAEEEIEDFTDFIPDGWKMWTR